MTRQSCARGFFFGRRSDLQVHIAVAIALLIGFALTADAFAEPGNKQPSKELREEARKVLGKDAKNTGSGTEKNSARFWCIAIISIRSEDRDQVAPIALEQIRTRGKLPEAYIDRRADATVIALGKYESPKDEQAQKDLERIRQIQVDNEYPYATAFICPPEEEPKIGEHPEYNLLQAKALFGSKALQSLQVAVYGRDDLKNPKEEDLKEARKAAETAAIRFRQDGELAFYYHGPRRSMVTIGIFDETDYDPQTPTYNSARLLELKKRHPYNLYNGAGIKEKFAGMKEARMQPSFLVKIPDIPASVSPSDMQPKDDGKNKSKP